MPYKPTGRPTGRPSKYDKEMVLEILQQYAEGRTITDICRNSDGKYPAPSTISGWVNADRDGLYEEWLRVRKLHASMLWNEAIDTLRSREHDFMDVFDSKGNKVGRRVDPANVQHRRNLAQGLMLAASRMEPKEYGTQAEGHQKDQISEIFQNVLDGVKNKKKDD